MNKNIIKVGVLLSASVMSDISLTSPVVDLYTDNILQGTHEESVEPVATQMSWTQAGRGIADATSIVSVVSDMSVRSVLTEELDDLVILESLTKRIQNSKSLPAEFSNVIDEDFWNLV